MCFVWFLVDPAEGGLTLLALLLFAVPAVRWQQGLALGASSVSAAFALLLGCFRVEVRVALALLLQCGRLEIGCFLERAACSLLTRGGPWCEALSAVG